MERIYVWSNDNDSSEWQLYTTQHYCGTNDELKYWRVMRNGKKEFYYCLEEYMQHSNLSEEECFRDSKELSTFNDRNPGYSPSRCVCNNCIPDTAKEEANGEG